MREFQLAEKFDHIWVDHRVTDPGAQRRALSYFLKHGPDGPGFFTGVPRVVEGFRAAIGTQAADIPSCELVLAMRSLLQRMRNWAAVFQLEASGVKWCEIFAVTEEGQSHSSICKALHQKVFSVGIAADEVRYLAGLAPGEYGALLASAQPEVLELAEAGDLEGLATLRRLTPPFHPGCRSRVKLALRAPSGAPGAGA